MTCVGLATEEHLFSGALRIEEEVKKREGGGLVNSIALLCFAVFFGGGSRLFPE